MYIPDNYDQWIKYEEELENMDLIDAYTTRKRVQKGERE